MTLKSSLSKLDSAPRVGADGISLPSLTVKIIKRHFWLMVLAAIGFLLNMPVAVALVWSNLPRGEVIAARIESYAEDMQTLFNIGSICIIIAGAVLAAFTLFRYLHNRRQVDFYHSLPIRREKMFAANMLAGLLVFLLPYLVAHALALPLLAGSGMLTYFDMGQSLAAIGMHIFLYMIMFALATLAMLLSGNMGGAIKILLSTYALCPILAGMSVLLGNTFLTDYAEGGMWELLLLRLSVIERYAMMFPDGYQVNVYWQDIVFGAIILIAALAAGLWLYKKRNSECAGATLAFAKQKAIFKYPYVVLAGVLGAVVMYLAGDRSLIWLAFGLAFFTIFTAQALEIAINRDFRAYKRCLRGAVASLVVVGAIVGAYGLDVCGYEKWQPTPDKVTEIYLNSYQLPGFESSGFLYNLRRDEVDVDNYYNINPCTGYYYYNNTLTITDPEAIAILIEIMQSEPVGYGEYYQDEWDSYYDYTDRTNGRVGFMMKNGTYKMRWMSYGGVHTNLELYKKLYEVEEVRGYQGGNLDIPEKYTIRLDDLCDYTTAYENNYYAVRDYSNETARKLWETYRAEYAALSSEEILTGVPLGVLSLQICEGYRTEQQNGNNWEEWDSAWYHSVKVYPEMTETIKMLRGLYGSEVLGNQLGKLNVVEIYEYTPVDAELKANIAAGTTDVIPIDMSGSADYIGNATYAVEDGYSYSTTTVTTSQVSEDIDLVAKQVDVSRAAEIIANTVAADQLSAVAYYDPWRRTGCLTYYEFTFQLEDGISIHQTRYMLP